MLKSKKFFLLCIFIFINLIFIFKFFLNIDSFIIENINECRTSGISIEGNNIITKSNDPMIYVDSKKNIYTIEITIDEMSEDFLVGQVFYYNTISEISEKKSIKTFLKNGKNIIYLPKNYNIKNVRIDIGDKENVYIKIMGIKINKNIPIFQYYALISIFYIICIFLCYHKYFIFLLEKNIKYVVFILIIIFIFILKINMSSLGAYSVIIPNNSLFISLNRIGVLRGIRGDEFFVNSVRQFMQYHNGFNNISYYFGEYGFNNNLVSEAPVKNLLSIAKPYTWGFLLFEKDIGFSWFWITQYFIALFFSYKFFSLIVSKKIALCYSFILVFSSGLQWWTYTGLIGAFFSIIYSTIFMCLYDKNDLKKILYFSVLIIFSLYYIIYFYPPLQIGFGFLVLITIYSTLILKKINLVEKIKLNKIYILIYFFLVIIYSIFFYLENKIDIYRILNTVYPGKRISLGGDVDIENFYNYIVNFILPFKEPNYSNQSKLSSFFTLFPTTFILYILKYKIIKNNILIRNLMIYSVIIFIYMIVGFNNIMAKITLFSFVPGVRYFIVFSFSQLVILLLMIDKIFRIEITKEKKKIIFFNLCLIIFYYYGFKKFDNIIEYMGKEKYILISIFLIILSNIIYIGYKKISIFIIIIISIITGLTINPINFGGTEILSDTPIAKKIRDIDNYDKGNWITLDDRFFCKYIVAQGVIVLNSLNYPPQIEMYKKIDYSINNSSIYNRYAHPTFELTEDKTEFILTHVDEFRVKININDLKKLDVKYIVTKNRINQYNNDNVIFEEIFYDDLDGYIFYKVKYIL